MNRRLPPLVAMRVFECAARYLSFTRAADVLGVTPPAVSHQIKALEDWLGTPLFKRLNRTIKLTKAGELYAPLLTNAFDILVEATNKVVNMGGARILRVAALDSFSSVWLLPRLHRFRERYRDLDVRFTTLGQDADPLSSGSVDLEIRYGHGSVALTARAKKSCGRTSSRCAARSCIDAKHPLKTLSDLQALRPAARCGGARLEELPRRASASRMSTRSAATGSLNRTSCCRRASPATAWRSAARPSLRRRLRAASSCGRSRRACPPSTRITSSRVRRKRICRTSRHSLPGSSRRRAASWRSTGSAHGRPPQ